MGSDHAGPRTGRGGAGIGWRRYVPEAALAGAVVVFLVAGALSAPPPAPRPQVLDYLLILVCGPAIAACRRAPVAALLVAAACMTLYSLRAHPGPPAAVPVLITVYAAVGAGRRTLAAGAGAVFLGAFLATDLGASAGQPAEQIVQRTILLLGWFVAAAVAGTVSRHRLAYLRQVEERAAEAERTREETALRRAGEERLRIARELHDSLTHTISIIKVQAGVAVHLARKRGEEVPAALLAIQEAGREAMRELRATLEVLREPGDEPVPNGVERLAGLVERARATGLPATLTVAGFRRDLPAEVDRAVYRIVQEALTNVARHAGPASASVCVGYGPGELSVRIDDDGGDVDGTGTGSDGGGIGRDAAPEPGVGLTGMRERVAALGGRLHAGPRPGGGFTVHAVLPAGERPAGETGPVPVEPSPEDPQEERSSVGGTT
ncbi:sensor histidine kinase [Planobispora takensis]|uniref:histidine kinase n=1 Tax=Planobispora takensis TaxID=1367882 RepID=A0A8J3SX85_9ACTN|nr:histidine kinase [Planobispora takensis]GII01386.1 two-component sensor histidine kinase [Planobispora takensis]